MTQSDICVNNKQNGLADFSCYPSEFRENFEPITIPLTQIEVLMKSLAEVTKQIKVFVSIFADWIAFFVM